MTKFSRKGSIENFQLFINDVYGIPDDRLYSLWDLLSQLERFTMRALKGIRKQNTEKVRVNLVIAFSWLMAIANRLHIDLEKVIWNRFPYLCSYCGELPCACAKAHPAHRKSIEIDNKKKPKSLEAYQKMFAEIYPTAKRTPSEAGVHLAEEMGEVSEAIHNFLGQHLPEQFREVELEISDFVSCLFGVANSFGIDMAEELEKSYPNNCHVCHEAPCVCTFAKVASIES
jgi:NTP pyrophosphatase (non-canonical NTP hydrolase)